MNYELRIRTVVRKILILVGFILFILFSAVKSYCQSPDHQSKTDKFGGIGVSVDIDSSVMLPYIVDILSAKPGAMAGLRSGDHIISINGWKTKGKSQEKVAGKLRGRVGSDVNLVIDRSGKDTSFTMKREHIEVNEKTGNLCEALDTLLKSISDSFKTIIGAKRKPLPIDLETYNLTQYESKVFLNGFYRAVINKYLGNKEFEGRIYFEGDFFIGEDSIEALYKYNRLLDDVRNCIPYSSSQSYIEEKDSSELGTSTTFKLTHIKDTSFASIVNANIVVWFDFEQLHLFQVGFSIIKR